ncbi:alanine racemase [Streptomyces sp. ST2-7A]|uniref:alanine racemase n=1 Tax=Streptomyces sp. ST2-7A TaxID=2907214 RepID=UPI001F3DEAF0|nr:alanine racemase [Streptomyces sp. ST2-7A]MCE7083000.1 alanine racemase [Streptomyces sp. ST2-7A]
MAIATALDRLGGERVDHRFKGLPPNAAGRTVRELTAERRNLYRGGFTTPILTLSAEAVEHNLRCMARYADRHGLEFAPHGKTSMAPQLFWRQVEHGAWGITVAVPHQARVARDFGVQRIFLANQLVDVAALGWLAGELAADPHFRCVVYVDSVRGVELMDRALRGAGARRPLEVVIELGSDGARSGVRDTDTALAVAGAVDATSTLTLVGVAGYEGELPEADGAGVRAWLESLSALALTLDRAGRFRDTPEIMISAGGSAWFDAVAEAFAKLPRFSRPVCRLLRSGAYISHDDGRYREVTPFNRIPEEGFLLPAFRLWAQVVSRPEPGLALINAGKRDVAYDLGLPEVQVVRDTADRMRRATGVTVTRLADQHAFLDCSGSPEPPEVGDWVGLGMSHPCTIFEKWPLIPLVAGDGTVKDYIRTFF